MSQVDLVGFSCASCGKQYRWKPELAGKTVRCKCGSPVSVPKQQGGAAPRRARRGQPRGWLRTRRAFPPRRGPPIAAASAQGRGVQRAAAGRRSRSAAPAPRDLHRPAKHAKRQQETRRPLRDNSGGADDGAAKSRPGRARRAGAAAPRSRGGRGLHSAPRSNRCPPDAVSAPLRLRPPPGRRPRAPRSGFQPRCLGLLSAKKDDPSKPSTDGTAGSFMMGVLVSLRGDRVRGA